MALISSFPALNLLGNASSSAPSYVSPTSSGTITGQNVTLTATYRTAAVMIKVNQAAPNSSQTATVYVEHSIDAGQTYDDFMAFLINGKQASASIMTWTRDVSASSSGPHLNATKSLSNNTVVNGPIGATWRAEVVCNTSASSSQAWQINVSAQVAQ